MSNLDRLRTSLANERTLLAYIRTALALLVFGMAAIKFFPEFPLVIFIGGVFMISGAGLLAGGMLHFRKISRLIREDQEARQ